MSQGSIPVSIHYATTGGILRQGSVVLEYPKVTETRLDGSSTAHLFNSWTERPDVMTDYFVRLARVVQDKNTGEYIVDTVTNISNRQYVNRILEPRSSLQHYRGSPQSVAEYASGTATTPRC